MAWTVAFARRGLSTTRSHLVDIPATLGCLSSSFMRTGNFFAVPNLLHQSQLRSFISEVDTTPIDDPNILNQEESRLPANTKPRTFTVRVHNIRVAPKKLNLLTKLVSLVKINRCCCAVSLQFNWIIIIITKRFFKPQVRQDSISRCAKQCSVRSFTFGIEYIPISSAGFRNVCWRRPGTANVLEETPFGSFTWLDSPR